MRTPEQLRAADALARVDELVSRSDEFKGLYRAYVVRLGPGIVMNGLGQALATEQAASSGGGPGGDAHKKLYDNLGKWLCRDDGGVYAPGVDLLHSIMANDESLYVFAQAEALAWLEWHKKLCRASLPPGAEE